VPSKTTSNGQSFAISIHNLCKRFNREWIFKDVSFEFLPGVVYAITGPNGSGKSTLLQVVWGQVPPTSGAIEYRKNGAATPIEEAFQHVSIATPYMDLVDEFTLREMLDFHFSLKSIREGFTTRDLIHIMYLENAAEKQLRNFSSGMKQRLKLGLALYTRADVYFLDEPGTNLDAKAFSWYRAELEKIEKTAIALIASNDANEYPQSARILNVMDYKS
jgi:ABC-type multidrug transport system ATPase subunit